MTLVIILNVILCGAVIVGVVAPLVWAILTQHRDEPLAATALRSDRMKATHPSRRRRRRLREATVWPAR